MNADRTCKVCCIFLRYGGCFKSFLNFHAFLLCFFSVTFSMQPYEQHARQSLLVLWDSFEQVYRNLIFEKAHYKVVLL